MMAKAPERLCEQTFPPGLNGLFRLQNLDAPPLSPYTSAVPEMDVIFEPPRRAPMGLPDGSGMEEDFARCPGAAN